jgi:hypothetical protein
MAITRKTAPPSKVSPGVEDLPDELYPQLPPEVLERFPHLDDWLKEARDNWMKLKDALRKRFTSVSVAVSDLSAQSSSTTTTTTTPAATPTEATTPDYVTGLNGSRVRLINNVLEVQNADTGKWHRITIVGGAGMEQFNIGDATT